MSNPLRMTLVFHIGQPFPADDLDELTERVEAALQEALEEVEFIQQDIENVDLSFEYL